MIKKVTTTYFEQMDTDHGFRYTFEPIENSIKIIEKKAFYITQDSYPESPDELQDNGLFLVFYHNDFMVRRDDLVSKQELVNWANDDDSSIEENYYIFGVEAYIHGEVVLAFRHQGNFPDRQWDVSFAGAILASKKEFPNEESARKAAKGLLQDWNCYLSGDVYGLVAEKFDEEGKSINCDSCWGYAGFEYVSKELEKMYEAEM